MALLDFFSPALAALVFNQNQVNGIGGRVNKIGKIGR
jgi:hypothetical protein